jgi:hypothetical protein
VVFFSSLLLSETHSAGVLCVHKSFSVLGASIQRPRYGILLVCCLELSAVGGCCAHHRALNYPNDGHKQDYFPIVPFDVFALPNTSLDSMDLPSKLLTAPEELTSNALSCIPLSNAVSTFAQMNILADERTLGAADKISNSGSIGLQVSSRYFKVPL